MGKEPDQKRAYWTSEDGQVVIYKLRGKLCGRSLYTLEYRGVEVMTPALFNSVQRYWREEFGPLDEGLRDRGEPA